MKGYASPLVLWSILLIGVIAGCSDDPDSSAESPPLTSTSTPATNTPLPPATSTPAPPAISTPVPPATNTPGATATPGPIAIDCNDRRLTTRIVELSQESQNPFAPRILKLYSDVEELERTQRVLRCKGTASLSRGGESYVTYHYEIDRDGDAFIGYEIGDAISTPTPAAMFTPTPTSPGLALDHPVPAGEILQGSDGTEISVLRTVEDAHREIAEENRYNDPPKEGKRFYMISVEVSYPSGSGSITVSDSDFSLIGENRVVYAPFDYDCGVIPSELRGEIFADGRIQGNICFEIPDDEAGLILIHEPRYGTESRRFLSLHPLEPSHTPVAVSSEPFKIGVMESLTGPGETYGTVANQAKQMALDEINEAGGIDGRMIELVVEDSKCSAQAAIEAYRRITEVDEVRIVLGTSCSGALLGVAPLAEKDGVVMFSGLATNPAIANAGDYIFRTSMSDAQLGIDTGNVLWADGIRTLATISEETDYAEGVRRTSVDQFVKLGGKVVAEERYPSDTTDFRTQLTKLIGANPDALHVAAQAEVAGGNIVKQVRELGYEGPIYSEVVVVGATALDIAGDAATGVKAITADLDPANNKAQEVIRNFYKRYGYVILPWYLGSAYDNVYITAECLKKTGDDQDTDGFRDCLYDITWSGAIGENYNFDEQGEVVGLSNAIVEVLPMSERNEDNQGYKVLGLAPPHGDAIP